MAIILINRRQVGMPRRKTPVEYRALANDRGFQWIGPPVQSIRDKTGWQCSVGHTWETTFSIIQRGSGCPHCSGRAVKTPADYHALAHLRGISWLGPEVPTVLEKTWWRCPKGHKWEAKYNGIQQGTGCPYCAGKRRKTSADYHALANDRGFHWLGPEVPNNMTKTRWACQEGHQWEAAYTKIQQGRGCPYCAGVVHKTPADYSALAAERGFTWLGREVLNTSTNTQWACQEGHNWDTSYSSILQGSGCPYCAGTARKTPDDYHSLAEKNGVTWLGPEVPNVRTKTRWRCSEGHEWDAPYGSVSGGHICPHCSRKARKTEEDYRQLATLRDFRWLGPPVPNVGTDTTWECSHGHTWLAPYNTIQQGYGCPGCAGVTPKTEEDYRALARERGFRWLGPLVSSVHQHTKWECGKGHRWRSVYHNIARGSDCPYCAGKAPKTPEDYHALAETRGFLWLGPEVPNSETKTFWRCEKGHEWETTYYSISIGSGCHVCQDRENGALVSKPQRKLHEMLGGDINTPFGRRNIDLTLEREGIRIAVEYDSWFEHGYKQEADAERVQALLSAGWRVLVIKSNTQLPTLEQLHAALSVLVTGAQYQEIVLPDWGIGTTRADIYN